MLWKMSGENPWESLFPTIICVGLSDFTLSGKKVKKRKAMFGSSRCNLRVPEGYLRSDTISNA